jgi:hypothetical protein
VLGVHASRASTAAAHLLAALQEAVLLLLHAVGTLAVPRAVCLRAKLVLMQTACCSSPCIAVGATVCLML